MGLGPRIDLRVSQQLVMSQQLQQAIKLLALSNLEIEAVIAEQLAKNPLLESRPGEGGTTENLVVREDREFGDEATDPTGSDELIAKLGGADDSPVDMKPWGRGRSASFIRTSFSMSRRLIRSSGAQKAIASPSAPARAVRPMRWTYCSGTSGRSKLTTWLTPGISIPRAAISVATRIGTSPERNRPSARSRWAWLLLPCRRRLRACRR